MHSIFSRTKNTSKQATPSSTAFPDEFGRVPSGGGGRSSKPSKEQVKDAKKIQSKRVRTVSGPGAGISSSDHGPGAYATDNTLPELPDGSFLPLNIPPKKQSDLHEYGYIGSETDVVLGLGEVQRLLEVVSHELAARGLTTPLLFSTQALDVSSLRVRSLIRGFLATCQAASAPTSYPFAPSSNKPIMSNSIAETKWREEARFAGPHELGMLLKWGLARVCRITSGFEVRGFLDSDAYTAWRKEEEDLGFPANHFLAILNFIPHPTHTIVTSLFSLLSRLCAYSSSSGLTPQNLATHFGPLVFGLGAPSLPFGPTNSLYLRSVHAVEHLLLSYILNSDYEARSVPSGIQIPSRLKDWIRGYPNMLPRAAADLEKIRTGVRTVRVASVRRNVRLYSPDLVRTATVWCGQGDLNGRNEWTRVVPSQSGEYSKPKYTDDYKKRLDLPKSFEPKTQYDPSPSELRSSTSTSNFSANPPRAYKNPLDDMISRSSNASSSTTSIATADINDDRFRNLTDMRWTEFSESGFSAPSTSLLQFDLTESARQDARTVKKRETLSWGDFSQSGFDRSQKSPQRPGDLGTQNTVSNGPRTPSDNFSDALKFSLPFESSINTWQEHSSDLTRKIRKQQKDLPPFGWDTSPVAGREWVVEEGMIQAWCELCLSSGWVDWEEGTFREANWVLAELKAVPAEMIAKGNRTAAPRSITFGDPRTSSQWFLFEEFVPREYRDQLQNPKKKQSRTLFSSLSSKPKPWKPAPTLNGQPYTGRPRSPNPRDFEFDAMLKGATNRTKVLSLSTPPPEIPATLGNARRDPQSSRTVRDREREVLSQSLSASNMRQSRSETPLPVPPPSSRPTISGPLYTPPPRSDSKGLPSVTGKIPPPLNRFKMGKPRSTGAEWDSNIEFETRTESDSSVDSPVDPSQPPQPPSKAGLKNDHLRPSHQRQRSKDDAWVDILILESKGNRRRPGADDRLAVRGEARKSRSHSDPEMAREEIQRAMMASGPYRPSIEDDAPLPVSPPPGFRPSQEEGVIIIPVAPEIRLRPPTIAAPPPNDYREYSPSNRSRDQVSQQYSDEEGDIEALSDTEAHSYEHPDHDPYFDNSPISHPQELALPQVHSTIPPSNPPNVSRTPSPNSQRQPSPEPSIPQSFPAGSKPGVSSLIQMYQKRDAAGLGLPSSPKPSRIPVSVPSQPTSLTSSVIPDEMTPFPTIISPMPILEPRVPSPARYVHGAPLQNVLEDEEYD